jgi:hypothetical protein
MNKSKLLEQLSVTMIPVMDIQFIFGDEDKDIDEIEIQVSNVNDRGEPPVIDVISDRLTEEEKQQYVTDILQLIKEGTLKIPHTLICNPFTKLVEYDESMWMD